MRDVRRQMEHVAHLVEPLFVSNAQADFAFENQRFRFERMLVHIERGAGLARHGDELLESLFFEGADKGFAFHKTSLVISAVLRAATPLNAPGNDRHTPPNNSDACKFVARRHLSGFRLPSTSAR